MLGKRSTLESSFEQGDSTLPQRKSQRQDTSDTSSPPLKCIDDISNHFKLKDETLNGELNRPEEILKLSFYLDDWRSVGRAAGLSRADISAIQEDGHSESDKRFRVLDKWHQINTDSATYKEFINILLTIKRNDIVQEVCKLLVSMQEDSPLNETEMDQEAVLVEPSAAVSMQDLGASEKELPMYQEAMFVESPAAVPRQSLESSEKDQPNVDTSSRKKRRSRCKSCANCLKPDCGRCEYCRDRKGPKKLRQACKHRSPCLKWTSSKELDPTCRQESILNYTVNRQQEVSQDSLSSGNEQQAASSFVLTGHIQHESTSGFSAGQNTTPSPCSTTSIQPEAPPDPAGNEQLVISSHSPATNSQPEVLTAALISSGELTPTVDDETTRLLEICGSQEITLLMTKCGIYGPAHSGKTTLRHLLLRKKCSTTHDSTDILADVDLISPDLDLVENFVSVSRKSKKNSVWVEVKDQRMLQLIANTMCVESPMGGAIEDASNSNKYSIAHFKVMKQLKQLLKKKLENSKKGARRLEKVTLKFVYLVDSGGQPQFLEVLPMFARNSSAHLLVHPLDKELDDIPSFAYKINGQSYSAEKEVLLSYKENIIHCVRSISSSRYRQGVQNSRYQLPKKPHIAIVGMYKDRIEHTLENSMERRNADISHCLSGLEYLETVNFELIPSSRDLRKPVFAIDGSKSYEENASELDKLQSGITDDARMIPVKLPLKWFIFLQAIKEDMDRSNKYFRSLDECRKIAQAKEIQMSTTETNEAIQLFDELNLILYFSSIHSSIVFTMPAFLCRKVTLLITQSFTNMDRQVDVHSIMRNKFHDKGIFSLDLIDICPELSSGFCEIFQFNDFLELLQKLCIISKIGENKFFMPCVLPLEKKENSVPLIEYSLPPLYISFGDRVSPRGLFCAVISSLVTKPMFEVNTKYPLKRNSIELTVYETNDYIHEIGGSMLLWDKITHFEVYCFGCDETLLPVVRKCLACAIYEAATIMHYDFGNVKITFGLRCTLCDESKDHGTSVSKKNNEWYHKCLNNIRKRSQLLKHGDQGLVWFYENSLEKVTKLVRPDHDELMAKVASIADKWKEVAIGLLFDFTVIELIDIDNSGSSNDCLSEIFSHWKKHESKFLPYSWNSIIEVLRAPFVNECTLAQALLEKFLPD